MSEMNWHTSSYSAGGGNCVEVAEGPEQVSVRDSQNRDLGVLDFVPNAWGALLGAIHRA